MIEKNGDPYLGHCGKSAAERFGANPAAARSWLERAVKYLQTRLVHP